MASAFHELCSEARLGAGKTSLIDILAGKNKSGHLTGTVTYTSSTGDPINRPRIGFVDQSDVLPSILTVQEALTFAARLRMPESVSAEEKEAKVFEVLQQLGLVDIKDARIGNIEKRGISGGEARRVSIGLELVASPDILVLDEPTSG
jgi:ABC-type multidrug transport system ATPase subunit